MVILLLITVKRSLTNTGVSIAEFASHPKKVTTVQTTIVLIPRTVKKRRRKRKKKRRRIQKKSGSNTNVKIENGTKIGKESVKERIGKMLKAGIGQAILR